MHILPVWSGLIAQVTCKIGMGYRPGWVGGCEEPLDLVAVSLSQKKKKVPVRSKSLERWQPTVKTANSTPSFYLGVANIQLHDSGKFVRSFFKKKKIVRS